MSVSGPLAQLEERMVLAETLHLETHLAELQRLRESLNLKFPAITDTQICQHITRNIWKHPRSRRAYLSRHGLPTLISSALYGLIGILLLSAMSRMAGAPPGGPFVIAIILCALAVVASVASLSRRIEVHQLPLAQWTYNIPYGALLAVKEATEQGYTDPQISYPVFRPADPVITAQSPGGTTCLIFEWDEGQQYA